MIDDVVSVSLSRTEAFEAAVHALRSVGTVVGQRPNTFEVSGRVRYGFERIDVQIRVVEIDSQNSVLNVRAATSNAWDMGCESAVERIKEAVLARDNPEFVPDRSGVSAWKMVMSLVLFAALLPIAVYVGAVFALLAAVLLAAFFLVSTSFSDSFGKALFGDRNKG